MERVEGETLATRLEKGPLPLDQALKYGAQIADALDKAQFDGQVLRGLEQNPDTKSRWAKMAREGKKVMQFLDAGRYVAVVVDGKMKTYG
jgi:hypothetical protein